MDATAEPPPETAESISTASTLRRVSQTVLSILHNRLELLTLELKEEKHRGVATLMIAVLASSLAVLSLVAVFVTVAFLVPAEGASLGLGRDVGGADSAVCSPVF